MRYTPAQLAMLGTLGDPLILRHFRFQSLTDAIRYGHKELVKLSGQDFGYDIIQWHEYLRKSNAGGYRWSNKHLGMPRRIKEALANPDWLEAVNQAKGDIKDTN